MLSGGAGEVVNGVGSIVCGRPPGGGGSKGGTGSVGLMGPSGGCGPELGLYGPEAGPLLNLLNCLLGIQGGINPLKGCTRGLEQPFAGGGAGDGHTQLSSFCNKLGSSPDGSLKLTGLLKPYL